MTTDDAMLRRRAVLFLVLAAALWSTSGLCIKMSDWQPLSILAGRSTLAAGVFLLYLHSQRNVKFRLTRVQVVGALALLATQVLFITATKMTTAANAIFLQYTAPLYVIPLSAWWLKEYPQRSDWVMLALIMVGMGFFFGDELSLTGLTGNLLALLSALTMAVMMVCMRAQKEGTPAHTILLSHIMGALLGLPWLVRESFTPTNLGIIAFLGIFQIGVAFVLYSIAVKDVRAVESTVIVTLEPILNPLWVFLVIRETPGPRALLGSALVIGAVTAQALISARVARHERTPAPNAS